MALNLSEANRSTIRQVFNLWAKDNRLDREGMEEIFKMIGYNVTAEQMEEMKTNLFQKKDSVSFDQFCQKMFTLQLND